MSVRVPRGLGPAGRALWRSIHVELGDGWELDARERAILEAAARQADLNRQLEEAVADSGVTVVGSQGQPRLSAHVTELRQGRIALAKLLAELALPSGDEGAQTAAQRRAQAAADTRWARAGKGRQHGQAA